MNGKELAREIGSSLNTLSFDTKGFCETMMNEHRTIQQSFMRLIRDYIEYVADQPEYMFDDRNEASREYAKRIQSMGADACIPFI